MQPDWAAAFDHLIPAIERYGETTWPEVVDAVERGEATLWQVPGSSAVSEPVRHFHIWLAGGRRDDLLSLEATASAYAKAAGFDRMTLIGRPGWRRVLAPLGYRPITLLVKDL